MLNVYFFGRLKQPKLIFTKELQPNVSQKAESEHIYRLLKNIKPVFSIDNAPYP